MAKTKKVKNSGDETFKLTREQFDRLKRVSDLISNASVTLYELKGSDDISSIMYDIGSCVNDINSAGDKLDEIIDTFNYHEFLDEEK